MTQEERIKIVLAQLTALQRQIELSVEKNKPLPEIEKDILLRKMQECYENLKQIHEPVSRPVHPELTLPGPDIVGTMNVQEVKTLQEPESGHKPATAEPAKQPPHRTQTFIKHEKTASLFDTLTEKAVQPEETLHERLSRKQDDKSLADKLSTSRISDLKKSIGINERFKFINELFESNTADYNLFIEKLNACSTSDEAFRLMEEEYAIKLGWNKEEEIYQSLVELVNRRFI